MMRMMGLEIDEFFWMEKCIFSSSMSVLVNENLIKRFSDKLWIVLWGCYLHFYS